MANKFEQRITEILASLPEEHAMILVEYAEFLYTRHGLAQEFGDPEPIPRPEKETVVNAIKRLTATYPMMDKGKLLNETSAFMMRHLLQGEDAVTIIDELEAMFKKHYDKLAAKANKLKAQLDDIEIKSQKK